MPNTLEWFSILIPTLFRVFGVYLIYRLSLKEHAACYSMLVPYKNSSSYFFENLGQI